MRPALLFSSNTAQNAAARKKGKYLLTHVFKFNFVLGKKGGIHLVVKVCNYRQFHEGGKCK